jgi:hypothetical protein
MPCGIRNIDTTGQHRHSQAIDGQCPAVRRPVDAVSTAGDYRDVALGQPDRQVCGHVLAVAGRGAGPDDGGRPLRHVLQPRRPEHPQRQRRTALRFRRDRGAAERSERQHRPFVVVGRDQSATATSKQFEIFGSTVYFTPCRGAPRQGVVDMALTDALGCLDRADPAHQSGELGARRLDDP